MTRLLLILPVALMGCANIPILNRLPGGAPTQTAPAPLPAETVSPEATAPVSAPPPIPEEAASSAETLDTVSEADKEAARAEAAAAPAGGELGEVTVSLGSPTDPGLWVKSDLVSEDTPGTVRTGSGDAIAVTLRPLGGAGGPQISLSALQALGLPLAGLFPVTLARAG